MIKQTVVGTYNVWRYHGTKVLGFVQGTVACLCGVAGLIPDSHLKYWLGASAMLTFWRGFFNTAQNVPPAPEQ